MHSHLMKLLCVRLGVSFRPSGSLQQMYFQRRFFTNSTFLKSNKNEEEFKQREEDGDDDPKRKNTYVRETRLSTETYFDAKEKNKETFNTMLKLYKARVGHRRGHVEFIYAAMKHLEEFGVQYDLQTYKNLISVLPKDKYVPENLLQSEMVHYPAQQYCIVDLLDYMEGKGVCPDEDMIRILVNRFGREGHPVRKCARMIYWMSKMKNASPWPIPLPPPKDTFALAKIAIERIVSVDTQSKVSIYQTDTLPEAIDHTYIISGQSPTQRELIKNHPKEKPIYVEGRFRIWLRTANITYFILRADPDPKKLEQEQPDSDDVGNMTSPFFYPKESKMLIERPSVHEQEDGTILAVCATGTSSRDSLLSWIRLLERDGNPALGEIPVLFTLKSPLGDVIPMNDDDVPHTHEQDEVKVLQGE